MEDYFCSWMEAISNEGTLRLESNNQENCDDVIVQIVQSDFDT